MAWRLGMWLTLMILSACNKTTKKNCYNYQHIDAIPCSELQDSNSKVLFTFGQSNSANHGESPYRSKRGVYVALSNGTCVNAVDPMFNASGCGGSIWTRLGDKIIDNDNTISNVIFIAVGVGGTSISNWAYGDMNLKLKVGLEFAEKNSLEIDMLLFQQGETDRHVGTTKDEYITRFTAMAETIRDYTNVPLYVAKSTRCNSQPYEPVREAVDEILSGNILAGPDTDTLDELYRFDGCHFSNEGLDEAATLWLNSL